MPLPFRHATTKKEPRRSLATGLELALRTGDPEGALEQLRPLRASCLSALGRPADEIQQRAARSERT